MENPKFVTGVALMSSFHALPETTVRHGFHLNITVFQLLL